MNYSEDFRIAKDDEDYPQGINDEPLDETLLDMDDYDPYEYYDDQDFIDDTVEEDRP